ncbi:MAG: DUF952 domain-containing protein [Caldilineaceae bacterium]
MIIYHMLPERVWQAQAKTEPYRADSLATEGFVHCTREAERLVEVANRFYREIEGAFVILCLETEQLQAEVRWEVADGHCFPHVYGPVDPAAVVDVIAFPRHPNGRFLSFM